MVMKTTAASMLFLAGLGNAANTEISILALDAEAMVAEVQMNLVTRLEQEAYTYARETYCIPERESQKVSTNELYDWIVGTSSGAIASAMLVQTNADGTPKYYASDVQQLFESQGENLFVVKQMSGVGQFFLCLAFIILFGLIGFCIGYRFHKDPTYEENIKAMEEYLEISEKIAIKQAEKAAADTLKTAIEDKMNRRSTGAKAENDATMKEFRTMIEKAECDPKNADECRKRMLELDEVYQQRRGFVLLWVVIFAIVGFFVFWFGIKALLDSVFYKPLTQAGAENILKEYIPEDLTFAQLQDAKLGIPTFELQD